MEIKTAAVLSTRIWPFKTLKAIHKFLEKSLEALSPECLLPTEGQAGSILFVPIDTNRNRSASNH